MAEVYTSPCLPIDQQPNFISYQNEECACIFSVGSQDKVMLQDFQDPFGSLLQALEKMNFVLFVSVSFGFCFYCEFPTCTSFFFIEESERKTSVSIHLPDWLHWNDHFT